MDFIDPEKQRQHKTRLILGYLLVACAILLTTLVLLFSAYGYGFGKNGQVIQNGLVFVSSQPNPATIYLNGVLNSSATNSRLQLPAGQYTLKLERSGYRTWIRSVGVEGGSVEHFDYPLLFPTNLVTTTLQQYNSEPQLLQSPDRRWLLIQQPDSPSSFYEYDLSTPKQLASTLTTVTIPANLITTGTGSQSWQVVQWSTDNNHVLLQHSYSGGSEYIMFDRQTPADSLNLTKSLNLSATMQLSLKNNVYNQYYLLDTASKTLATASLSVTQPTVVLNQVLAFQPYGTNVLLYATTKDAPSGKANIDVLQGTNNYIIQHVLLSTQYLLDMTQYSGNWFVVAGVPSEDKVYVYENPMSQLQGQPTLPLVPVYILRISQPNYVAFSSNAQFVMAENGDSFMVYDAENSKSYAYNLTYPLAAGQHATWMDGDRLSLEGAGNLVVFDYDDANQQSLQPAVTGATPFFDPNYQWSYVLAKAVASNQAGQFSLTSTSLRIPADQ